MKHGADLGVLHIPGVSKAISLRLPEEIACLRDNALRKHHAGGVTPFTLPELTPIDANTWSSHPPDEDWLMWRARRCAERLRNMPIELQDGELIVGRPRLRDPDEADGEHLRQARAILSTVPPYPGGDCGHLHPDYSTLFDRGIGGLLSEIDEHGGNSFHRACGVALRGLSDYIRRVGAECRAKAATGGVGRTRWEELSGICLRVSSEPPATFREAVQLMYVTIVGLWFGEDHPLTSPGRMDQTLWAFYEADLESGRSTREEAFNIVCCLFIQLNRILFAGSALSVIVGGRDRFGRDVTNELTSLCLGARMATRLSYPTIGLAWHAGTPDHLMTLCTKMAASGLGDPAFFNDELIAAGLRDHGVRPEDACNYMNSTCVEIKVVGCSNIWVAEPYINLAGNLLDVLDRVVDGRLPHPEEYVDLEVLLKERLGEEIRGHAQRLDRMWTARGLWACFPLADCFTNDCLKRGVDIDRGGARYNWVENSFVGLANLVDSLVAIRTLVYETSEASLKLLHSLLVKDFAGDEQVRLRIANRLPKYGNDDESVDRLAAEWAEFLMDATEANSVGPHRYVPGFFCWIMYEKLGSETGATPDGRRARAPLADGAGAAQGREGRGPTASVRSTTRWDHRRALGGLVHNVRFSPAFFKDEADFDALRHLVETYMRRGGFEIQINVVGNDVLRDAQEHPDSHADLLVRVAGYSDYFTKLNRNMQDEIISRTEHGA